MKPFNARERGLGAFQGTCVALLLALAMWAVIALVIWVVF